MSTAGHRDHGRVWSQVTRMKIDDAGKGSTMEGVKTTSNHPARKESKVATTGKTRRGPMFMRLIGSSGIDRPDGAP